MKTPLAALATFLLAGLAPAQEGEEKKPAPPCDLAAVEDGFWCGKCKKVLEAEQLSADKCKSCDSTPEKIPVCVKKWIPRCGMHDGNPHLEPCCKSKMCCKAETLKNPVIYRCEGCGQSARTEAAIAHDAKAHDKNAIKTCEGSGTRPHGGEPIP
jgi:hypothetical protein